MTHLLIVNDEDNIATALGFLLMREGYAQTRVRNGGEALAMMQACRFDGLLLDMMLPDMSGLDLLRRLRAQDDAPPTLMMTVRGAVRETRRAFASGAAGILPKPFDLAELRAELMRLVPNRKV